MELPYYTAEFLNVWMKSDSDDILDALYDDTEGTMGHTSAVKELYQSIKRECPETIFHGTDVGHQYDTTGKRFLEYLDSQGQENSKTYALTVEAIKQGEYYYKDYDEPYRENMMAQNFMREYDALGGESVAGFFGAAHTKPEALDFYGNVPCMANQLKQQYGDVIFSENLQP